jgi:hypothetical protein
LASIGIFIMKIFFIFSWIKTTKLNFRARKKGFFNYILSLKRDKTSIKILIKYQT